MKISAVLVCAGSGSRFGADKLLRPLGAEPLVMHTVRAFTSHSLVDEVIVVAPQDKVSLYKLLTGCKVVAGGASRGESVRHGLIAASGEFVLIHDGARPYVSQDLISRVIHELERFPSEGVVPVVPVADSLMGPDGYVPRSEYRAVQTPQGFPREALLSCDLCATDEGQVFAEVHSLRTVEGEVSNRKITYDEDIPYRTGIGYDVHRKCTGHPLRLCGVDIPHEQGLEGHSDADVVLHALMDALLSSAALPDIGHHFPPGDPAYLGADSRLLLDRVLAMVDEKGLTPHSVSIAIVAETPKLAPHLMAMRAFLSKALSISVDAVGITCTTNEHLPLSIVGDLCPSTEGIAAIANVLMKK